MRPAFDTPPPLPAKCKRPAMKSPSAMSRVEATKPPTRTVPVEVMAMPFGLTRKTWPFADRLPASVELVWPVTRFSTAEAAEGWTKSTRAALPMSKLLQLSTARSLVWRTTRLPGPLRTRLAWPLTTCPPCGRVGDPGASARLPAPASSSAAAQAAACSLKGWPAG